MVHELFYKMPRSLLPAVVKQVADFVLGLSSAQGTMDTGALVMTAAELLPDTAIELIMNPVMRMLREDAETLQGVYRNILLLRVDPIKPCGRWI
jgi:hypothetical protein